MKISTQTLSFREGVFKMHKIRKEFMAAKTFTTTVQLKNYLELACAKAVEAACNRLLGTLQELIMSEYYDESVYKPTGRYNRTMQFYDSAMTELLSKTCGQIFMNPDKMNYPFSGYGWSWDGAAQIFEANKGVHGGWSTEESKQHRYFDEFEKYCEKNAVRILKEELRKQGLNVK